MKHFKKKGFWVFYVAIVLAGAFIIVALGLQNQSPGIPNVSAQINALGSQSTPNAYSHPGSYIFQAAFPGDIMRNGSEMRTIMTCSGCSQTISTCNWRCGPTFTQCGTRGGQGSILGLLGGSYYTFGTCPTMSTCPPMCTIGGDTWIFCPKIEPLDIQTMSTCPPVCIDGGQTYGSALLCRGGINTLMSCSSSLFGGCGGGENYNKKYPTSVGCTSYGPYMGCLSYPISGSASLFTQSPPM